MEIEGDGVERDLPGRQGRLLFAYLVLNRHRPVRRDELRRGALVRGGPAAQRRRAAAPPLSRLRKALGAGAAAGPRASWRSCCPATPGSTGRRRRRCSPQPAAAAATGDWRRPPGSRAGGCSRSPTRGLLPGLEATLDRRAPRRARRPARRGAGGDRAQRRAARRRRAGRGRAGRARRRRGRAVPRVGPRGADGGAARRAATSPRRCAPTRSCARCCATSSARRPARRSSPCTSSCCGAGDPAAPRARPPRPRRRAGDPACPTGSPRPSRPRSSGAARRSSASSAELAAARGGETRPGAAGRRGRDRQDAPGGRAGRRGRRASPCSTGAATRRSCSRSGPGSRCWARTSRGVDDDELRRRCSATTAPRPRAPAPELRGRVPGPAGAGVPLDPETERRRLFDAVDRAGRGGSPRAAPLLLVTRRPALGRPLVAAARAASSCAPRRSGRVLLLGTYRDNELGDAPPARSRCSPTSSASSRAAPRAAAGSTREEVAELRRRRRATARADTRPRDPRGDRRQPVLRQASSLRHLEEDERRADAASAARRIRDVIGRRVARLPEEARARCCAWPR